MAFSPEIALESLRRAHAAKRLAHAYLITGGDDTSRRRLAAQLTRLAIGTAGSDGAIPTDPDVWVIEPELKTRRISIDAMRDLTLALSKRATRAGGLKIGVLLDAERMTTDATNAFLKTLEEPPGASLLILVTGRPEGLLETILSRCLRVELVATRGEPSERERMVATLLDEAVTKSAGVASHVAGAYGALREFQSVLGAAKEEIRGEEETEFEAAEDKYERKDYGDWLDEREE